MKGERDRVMTEFRGMRFPAPLVRRIDQYAEASGVSFSEAVRAACLRVYCPLPSDREIGA